MKNVTLNGGNVCPKLNLAVECEIDATQSHFVSGAGFFSNLCNRFWVFVQRNVS